MTSLGEITSSPLDSENSNTLPKLLLNKETNERGCFSGSFEAISFWFSQGQNTVFAIRPQFQVHKTCFPALSKLWKETPRTHCSIPWEKKFREGFSWVLTAIPVVSSLIWWNWTSWWLPSKKRQAAHSFWKTQRMAESCCHNAQTNEPLCFFLAVWRLQLYIFHRRNILTLPYYLDLQLQDNTFPCTFRAV